MQNTDKTVEPKAPHAPTTAKSYTVKNNLDRSVNFIYQIGNKTHVKILKKGDNKLDHDLSKATYNMYFQGLFKTGKLENGS